MTVFLRIVTSPSLNEIDTKQCHVRGWGAVKNTKER